MKKLFISQPMRGRESGEILAERKRAEQAAREYLGEEVEVLPSYFEGFGPGSSPLKCLAKAIECLADADVAFFTKGWEGANGCRIEYNCATCYGIPCIGELNLTGREG